MAKASIIFHPVAECSSIPRTRGRPLSETLAVSATRRGGFTLVEIILVIAIIVLAFAIALPTIGRSLKSAKLKTAAREAIVLSRYARNAAILHQRHHVMMFNPEARKLELVSLERSGFQGGMGDPFASLENARQVESKLQEQEEQAEYQVKDGGIKAKTLPEGVGIEDFTCSAEDQEHNGVYWVNYYPNGMCDAHSFSIADTRGRKITVKVDGITGEIHTGMNW